MAEDPKKPAEPVEAAAAEVQEAPVLPSAIKLNVPYAWFNKYGLVQRNAGDIIADAGEVAYLVELGANFTVV